MIVYVSIYLSRPHPIIRSQHPKWSQMGFPRTMTREQFVDACMLAGTEYCLTFPYLQVDQADHRSLTFVLLVLIGLEMFPQSTITTIVAWFLSHYFSIISYHIISISISYPCFSSVKSTSVGWFFHRPLEVMRFNFDVESQLGTTFRLGCFNHKIWGFPVKFPLNQSIDK